MFGFSPGKILFTIVVIVVVLAVFKFMGRMSEGASGSARPKATPKSKPARKAEADKAAEGIEDMVQCSVCGSYVAAASARNCGRDNCPYG